MPGREIRQERAALPDRLSLRRIRPGQTWVRVHRSHRDPLWFGPGAELPATHRFHDPEREFGTCFLGMNHDAAFAETILRGAVEIRLVARSLLATFSFTIVRTVRPVRLVRMYGPGLAHVGAAADVTHGTDYEASQRLGRDLWAHRDRPDGIIYRARHDDDVFSIGLFDRARDSVRVEGTEPVDADDARLQAILHRYRLGLVE